MTCTLILHKLAHIAHTSTLLHQVMKDLSSAKDRVKEALRKEEENAAVPGKRRYCLVLALAGVSLK